MTTNLNGIEIQEALIPKQTIVDRLDVGKYVFEVKQYTLIQDIIELSWFSWCIAHDYMIKL